MSQIRIAICQIPLKLNLSKKIVNIDEHINLIKICLEHSKEENANYVVFPEYTYCAELEDLYRGYSEHYVIVGGSYISTSNHNETVIAMRRELFFYKKVFLSTLEDSPIKEQGLNRGPEEPFYFVVCDNEKVVVSVLTCRDYYERVHNIALNKVMNNGYVDIIFAPSCNYNKKVFYAAAEDTHNRRDSFYSVICNVASLTIYDNDGKPKEPVEGGESCVFGLYDDNSREHLVSEKLCDSQLDNMILSLSVGNKIGLLSIEVPYNIHRERAMEFVKNPQDVNVITL